MASIEMRALGGHTQPVTFQSLVGLSKTDATQLTSKVTGATRHSLSALAEVGYGTNRWPKGVSRTVLLLNYPSILAVPLSGLSIASAYGDGKEALAIDDKEGIRDALLSGLEGGLSLGEALLWADFWVSEIFTGVDVGLISAGMVPIGIPLGLGEAAAAVGIALDSIGLHRCYKVSQEAKEIIAKDNEEEAIEEGMEFFQKNLSLTTDDLLKIEEKIDQKHPLATDPEKAEIRKVEVQKALKKKFAQFKRRVGNKTAKEVVKEVSELERGLKADSVEKGKAAEKIRTLLSEVEKKSFRKSIAHVIGILGAVIAIVGIVALALGAPLLLYTLLFLIACIISLGRFVYERNAIK